ncbi:Fc receptor%2C IgE, high affinity I, gamma polypeptide like isoform X2 [Xyrichtys novacula]|uniref:Fc receptor, IgE, high affinity I, gamma polypeptide like isoform X2 n=2 Tax=Xyrichtys novacula TaxID=13765 RepID=A0AAV1GIE2_XYRNO|nr:Fc receptor%2C IgE, high affinity I, gamma polypeptide like isoform X2 [Xyrichtys novacula]
MRALVFAAFLMINPTCTEATGDMNYCYILDGILILYGIILTILYCQLRMGKSKKAAALNPEVRQSCLFHLLV